MSIKMLTRGVEGVCPAADREKSGVKPKLSVGKKMWNGGGLKEFSVAAQSGSVHERESFPLKTEMIHR